MANRVTGFLKRRVEAARAVRASGGSVGAWAVGEFGRQVVAAASRLDSRASSGELSRALSAQRRLNFGCGYDRRDGFLNVDSDPVCKPDVLISEHSLSAFPRGHYETIVAKDVLEHIPRLHSQRVLLQFNDWLADGGVLHLQTSSILGVAKLLEERPTFESHYGMVNCLFGSQAHPGDFHFTGFTETTLKVMLLATGFSFGEFSLVDGWMFKLEARKERGWFEDTGSDSAFMSAVFEKALGRGPQPHEVMFFTSVLQSRGRREAALEIFASFERLCLTARAHGFSDLKDTQ